MVPGTGDLVAGVRIGEFLGSGGSGVVYRATSADGTMCALKVVAHPDEPRRQRVLRELALLRVIDHPNVVRLFQGGETPDAVWLALELVEGPTLEQLLLSYVPNDDQVDALVRGLLAGVAAAHRAGIVHRDLKPGNVLLQASGDQLIPRVVDFGIARPLVLDGPRPTRSGATLGTPAYMAPEQFRSAKNADERADVYALGAIAYELVTGVRPFAMTDLVALHDAKRSGNMPPVEAHRPNVPTGWAAVIARAMDPDPARRYADATELLAAWNRGPLWAERHRTAMSPRPPSSGTLTAEVVTPTTVRSSPSFALVGSAVVAAGSLAVLAAVAIVGAVHTQAPASVPPAPVAATPATPEPVAVAVAAPAPEAPAIARIDPVAATRPPPSSPPPSPVTRIDVEGAIAVLVTADDRQLPPGDVPPGTYTVRLVNDPDVGLSVTVAVGESRVVRCEPRLRSCR